MTFLQQSKHFIYTTATYVIITEFSQISLHLKASSYLGLLQVLTSGRRMRRGGFTASVAERRNARVQ